ncbi:uncharacterized protein J4E87_002486 [Alternaria ethzedia]|uniref:uncharacterized protein n=1 Tax=Alternaria ethzedia TaxID=181014 RepID=UPI0020C46F31|nr:uncharacterized protein J4E87_002486 [Alternaria ethzedia]KAI4631780.1 hypothetical protein J4E87_002486 [Alternaria ethzedia]
MEAFYSFLLTPHFEFNLPTSQTTIALQHHLFKPHHNIPLHYTIINMPPKAAAEKAGKVFTADVVAAVLCSTGTTSLSNKNYEMMSALDGVKTASGFQHDFRSVLAKAKELKARLESGEEFEPVPPGSKRGQTTPATSKATPKKRKDMSSGSEDTTPSKKKTATPKSRGKKAQTVEDTMEEDFPDDAEEFIKREKKWEEDIFT